MENSKTVLNLNSKFSWKIPSPKKDMQKDMFFGILLGGRLLLLLDFRVNLLITVKHDIVSSVSTRRPDLKEGLQTETFIGT